MSSLALPWDEQPGQPNNINRVMENDEAIRDRINGNLEADNLTPAEAAKLGLTAGATVRRGKSIIATEETRTNTAYGLLTTPDRVSGIVLPTDGLLVVAYSAAWKESVDAAARAAIFLGANQLKVSNVNTGAPAVQEAACSGGAGVYQPFTSGPYGLIGFANNFSTPYTDDVTTGQPLGVSTFTSGPCYIFAAAGTYDVSVQFKASSGDVTAKGRKLWVWTMGF